MKTYKIYYKSTDAKRGETYAEDWYDLMAQLNKYGANVEDIKKIEEEPKPFETMAWLLMRSNGFAEFPYELYYDKNVAKRDLDNLQKHHQSCRLKEIRV